MAGALASSVDASGQQLGARSHRRAAPRPAGWGWGHACAVSGERTRRAPPQSAYMHVRVPLSAAPCGTRTCMPSAILSAWNAATTASQFLRDQRECRRAGPRGLPTRAAGPQCAKAVSATVPTAADSNCSGVGSERRSVVWAEPSRNGPQTAQTGRLPGPQVANNELLAPSRRRVVWPAGWGCGHACAVSGERTRAPPHGVYGPLRRRVLCARAGGTTRCSRFQQTRRLSADLRPGQAPRLPRLRPVP